MAYSQIVMFIHFPPLMVPGVSAKASQMSRSALRWSHVELLAEECETEAELSGDSYSADGESGIADWLRYSEVLSLQIFEMFKLYWYSGALNHLMWHLNRALFCRFHEVALRVFIHFVMPCIEVVIFFVTFLTFKCTCTFMRWSQT